MRFFRQGLYDWWTKIFEPAPNETRRIPTEIAELVLPVIPALSSQLWSINTMFATGLSAADVNPYTLDPAIAVGKALVVKTVGFGGDDAVSHTGLLEHQHLGSYAPIWRGTLDAVIGVSNIKAIWQPPQTYIMGAGDTLRLSLDALTAGKKQRITIFGVYINVGEPPP